MRVCVLSAFIKSTFNCACIERIVITIDNITKKIFSTKVNFRQNPPGIETAQFLPKIATPNNTKIC